MPLVSAKDDISFVVIETGCSWTVIILINLSRHHIMEYDGHHIQRGLNTERWLDLLLLFKSGDRPLKIGHGPADEKG